MEDVDFHGWDPFDALNSKVFNATPLARSAFARLAWTQLLKRSPINFRRILDIAPTTNAVTLALATEIYRRDGQLARATEIVDQLLSLATDEEGGASAWGYPFAWQAKAFYVPKDAPNVIATAYAVRELVNWQGQLQGRAETAIVSAAHYVATTLARISPRGQRFLAYVANSDAMVHNANLWAAFVLSAGWKIAGNENWRQMAVDAVQYTLKAQREDGSWVYGEAAHHQFTDGFHTGYVLEALHRLGHADPSLNFEAQIARGFDFYLHQLIAPDGTARYYAKNSYPVDGNCAAQFIITLDALGKMQNHLPVARLVLEKIIETLWLEKHGKFAYQKSKWVLNEIDYPRWTQIWLALALKIVANAQGSAEQISSSRQSISVP